MIPSLAAFDQMPRADQCIIGRDALAFYDAAQAMPPGVARRRLYSAPTGTGKGTTTLALLSEFAERGLVAICVTPSLEVIRGFLQRTGIDDETIRLADANELAGMAEHIGVYTYARLYRRVLRNAAKRVHVVIIDEAHHWSMGGRMARTLTAAHPLAVLLGLTATPYRGSPRATRELIAAWGEPCYALDLPEATRLGLVAIPRFAVEPLLDDDLITVSSQGEFIAREVDTASASRVGALAALAQRLWGLHRVPGILTLPSTGIVDAVQAEAARIGLPVAAVTQETSARERGEAFAACREMRALLIAIGVVSEGVDLPWLRLAIDARPTMSPVVWLQFLGRIMRPGERGWYYCTNRNVERHAYLLAGCVPSREIQECQSKFERPGNSGAVRILGLEALDRLKAFDLPARGGGFAKCYALTSTDPDTGFRTDYSVIHAPWKPEPIVLQRTYSRAPDGSTNYAGAKWIPGVLPGSEVKLTTRQIRKSRGLTDKQKSWWLRNAARVGLEPTALGKIDARCFDSFAALATTGMRIL